MADFQQPPSSRSPRIVTEGSKNIMYSSPNPVTPQHIFDSSLFSMGASANDPVSRPSQPAIPNFKPNEEKRGYQSSNHSPSISHLRPTYSGHNSSPPVSGGPSPGRVNVCYDQMQNGSFSGDSSSAFSPSSVFPGTTGSSPGFEDMGAGFSGNTTPGFDTLDMPELSEEIFYNEIDPVVVPHDHSPAAAVRSRYPPSPRATISPSPTKDVLKNTPSLRLRNSPIVKIEEINTPSDHRIHPGSFSHETNSSSSSSGLGGADSGTVRHGEDGSWRCGLDPAQRAAIADSGQEQYVEFNLKELEVMKLMSEKAADIEEWMRKNSLKATSNVNEKGSLEIESGQHKRAKSVADFRRSRVFGNQAGMKPGKEAVGHSTGMEVDDADNDEDIAGAYDYEDDSSAASSYAEGSLDDSSDELPPTEDDLKTAAEKEDDEQRRMETDPSFHPKPQHFYSSHPWNDIIGPVTRGATIANKNQPYTANAAIAKFQKYAENIETASRVATFGSQMSKSRRLSAGDAEKILVESKLFTRLSFGRDKEKEAKDKEKDSGGYVRKPSIFSGIGLPKGLKRGFSNAGDRDKEKYRDRDRDREESIDEFPGGRRRGDSAASGGPGSSIISRTSWGKSSIKSTKKPLKVDTAIGVGGAFAQIANMTAGVGKSSGHTTASPSPAPVWSATSSGFRSVVGRVRSSSDLSGGRKLEKKNPNQPMFGITSVMAQYGGPPALPIRSPILETRFTFGPKSQIRGVRQAKHTMLSPDRANHHHRQSFFSQDDEDADMEEDTLPQRPTVSVRPRAKLEINPTIDGFAANVGALTPGLMPKLMERVGHEQCKRYKKLVDHRQKHLAAIKKGGKCMNGAKCRAVVGAVGVGGRPGVFNGHRRVGSGEGYETEVSSDDTGEHSPTEGGVTAAQFPTGVPEPPVSRLPAEFECPICFKVKKFNKPSDWTKHVHEDIQPFTCTFPDCTEPKSFKRKADWVRHENERHRHLEWWTCNLPDCSHKCYRKDNFVQHLVREHKMPEPKVKSQKQAKGKKVGKQGIGPDGPSQEDIDKVWQIVDECHHDTDKQPSGEPCRFCGAVCSTWKKLTVHLARHMEQISLPVLDLIKDDAVVPVSQKSQQRALKVVEQTGPAQEMDIDPPSQMAPRHLSTSRDYEGELAPSHGLYPAQSYDVNHQIQSSPPPPPPPPQTLNDFQAPASAQASPFLNSSGQSIAPLTSSYTALTHGFTELIPTSHPQTPVYDHHQASRDVYSMSPSAHAHGSTITGVNGFSASPPTSQHGYSPAHQHQYPPPLQPHFAYRHASGQAQGPHQQIHSQTMAHAQGMTVPEMSEGYYNYGLNRNGVGTIGAPGDMGMGSATEPDDFFVFPTS